MLANLCDYKQSVTLIENSGVQFLDFGLTPIEAPHDGRFVRKTANGPLLRLDYDIASGKFTLPARHGGQPEVVKPESSVALSQSLAILDGVWLPLPVLRFNPPRTFVQGPDNWARVQIRKLSEPDGAGNTHRVT
ncbi:virulence factor SrfB, partial [Cronobacter malonaticus]